MENGNWIIETETEPVNADWKRIIADQPWFVLPTILVIITFYLLR